MRDYATGIDVKGLQELISQRGRKEGGYHGGLCDIVGTGGDSHNTFNISTTSSILASALLMIAKHGNKASTSRSGSADLLSCAPPKPPVITAIAPNTIHEIYSKTNYAFLFAPIFHPGARHAASIRRQLGWRTIFNLLGPLANPLHDLIEARVLGVARKEIGPDFAESLKQSGCKKGMIICGDEELDELSCAGPTHCWRIVEVPPDDPILHFVYINTAALFVVSGICDADTSNMGEGDDGNVIKEVGPGGGRWKEGVRRAKWAISSGAAYSEWQKFVEVTNSVA